MLEVRPSLAPQTFALGLPYAVALRVQINGLRLAICLDVDLLSGQGEVEQAAGRPRVTPAAARSTR